MPSYCLQELSWLRVRGQSAQPYALMSLSQVKRFHRLLNRATWSTREASCILLGFLVEVFVPQRPLTFGIDDTLERRWGSVWRNSKDKLNPRVCNPASGRSGLLTLVRFLCSHRPLSFLKGSPHAFKLCRHRDSFF